MYTDTKQFKPKHGQISIIFLLTTNFYLLETSSAGQSEEVVKYVLFILKETGIQNVPSLSSLKNMQFGDLKWEDLIEEGTDKDNIPLWTLKPSQVAKLLVSNPDVSKSLIRYPRKGDVINHPADAEKWQKDLIFHTVTENDQLYVRNQLYTFVEGDGSHMGRIKSFFKNSETNTMEAVMALILPSFHPLLSDFHCPIDGLVITDETQHIPVQKLKKVDVVDNILYVVSGESLVQLSAEEILRDVEQSNFPVVSVPINLFLDDTSTNISKRWLPLHCIQMQLSGMPLTEKNKHWNVQFLGASEKVDIMDVGRLIVKDIQQCEKNGVQAYDASENKECLVKVELDVIVADYNMLSYCCNHLGATSNKYCPRCYADSENFDKIVGKRTPEDTTRTINRIEMHSKEADKTKLRRQKGIKEHPNCLWDILDPHRDIPVGLLHLVPLGLAKHAVSYIISTLDDNKMKRLGCHLEDCLQGKTRDFFKFLNSRQGKDFKEYLQVAPFNMAFGGVSKNLVQIICCLALIQKQLSAKSFDADDLKELQTTIQLYQNLIKQHAPELQSKAKSHMLLHTIEDIQRHGPLVAYSEDGFEKQHGIIRKQVFLENQKARSRDTAVKFAKHMICNHVVTGGIFQDGDTWKQASSSVMELANDEKVKDFFGRSEKSLRSGGQITKLSRMSSGHILRKTIDHNQHDTFLLQLSLSPHVSSPIDKVSYIHGKALLTSTSKELVNMGDWVKYLNDDNQERYGIFKEGAIVSRSDGPSRMLARIQKAEECKGLVLGCPKYKLKEDTEIILSKNVLEKAYFMHICLNCHLSEEMITERIENQPVTHKKLVLKHNKQHSLYLNNFYKLQCDN